MNNPYNLPKDQRGITPHVFFNRGINIEMSKDRRRAKQARHRKNAEMRAQISMAGPKGTLGRK